MYKARRSKGQKILASKILGLVTKSENFGWASHPQGFFLKVEPWSLLHMCFRTWEENILGAEGKGIGSGLLV